MSNIRNGTRFIFDSNNISFLDIQELISLNLRFDILSSTDVELLDIDIEFDDVEEVLSKYAKIRDFDDV